MVVLKWLNVETGFFLSGLWLDSVIAFLFVWYFDGCILLLFAGIYICPKCGHKLFSAKAKYKHNTPWPAFTETIRADSVSKADETEPQTSSKAKALKVVVQ